MRLHDDVSTSVSGRALRRRATLVVAIVVVAAAAFVVIRPFVDSGPTQDAGEDAEPWRAVEWALVEEPFPAGAPKPLRIDGLAFGNGQLLGWGRVEARGRNQFNDMGAVFATTDARRWQVGLLDDGVGANDTSEPFGLAVGPLGYLAYGGVCCDEEARAAWHSADGRRWDRLRLDGDLGLGSAWFNRVIGLPTGWIAVGNDRDRAAIWTSVDGGTWREVDPDQAGLGRGSVSDVVFTGSIYLAIGTIDDRDGTHDGGVWTSPDGIDWSRVAAQDASLTGPDETELYRVVPFGGGMFLVGNHGPHAERVQCEQLLGAVSSTDAEPPAKTALSCGWGREHHWLSADGTAWRRLPPLDPPPGLPAALDERPSEFRLGAGTEHGLVTLGEDTKAPDGDSGLWVSEDGATWRSIEAFSNTRPMAGLSASAVVGRTVIAIGDDVGGPRIWVGQVD